MTSCEEIVFGSSMFIVKNVLNVIMIVAPILLMISLTIFFIKSMANPDEKKNFSKVRNSVIALMIIFFIPVIVNIVMSILGEKYELSSCWINAKSPSTNVSYVDVDGKTKKSVIYKGEYEKGDKTLGGTVSGAGEPYTQLSFSKSGSGKVKSNFTPETLNIVKNHLYDFDYSTFKSYTSQFGGAGNYIKSLGGVFTKYYGVNPKVTTVQEFQEVSEYVYGLMYIYGFDYYSGSKYCKWGGTCGGDTASDDAFYPSGVHHTQDGLSDKTHFDRLITGRNEINMTTNCNWSVDMVYIKAGIWDHARGSSYKSVCKGNIVPTVAEYRVGDVLHFFQNNIDYNDMSTWKNWYHTAYIGEVYDDYVVVYDGGSRFTNNRNFKWKIKKTDNSKKRVACRTANLT